MIVGHGIDLQEMEAIESARIKHQGFPKRFSQRKNLNGIKVCPVAAS